MSISLQKLVTATRRALGTKGKPLSQARFGELVGVSQVGVSRWESGADMPAEENLLKLIEIEPAFAKFLPGRALSLPVYTMVAAGALSTAETVLAAQVAELRRIPVAGLKNGDYFILDVDGDSMDKVAPPDSYIVVDRADRELIAGKDYIFMHEGRATFKRWRARPRRLEPFSHNPAHDPIELDDLDGITVVGRVVKVCRDL